MRNLLEWAYEQNPGPWFEHSINVAQATENIIIELIKNGYNLDADIPAHNAALLHDIGRYKGFYQIGHSFYDGYMYELND